MSSHNSNDIYDKYNSALLASHQHYSAC